jgi:hypothetical protein
MQNFGAKQTHDLRLRAGIDRRSSAAAQVAGLRKPPARCSAKGEEFSTAGCFAGLDSLGNARLPNLGTILHNPGPAEKKTQCVKHLTRLSGRGVMLRTPLILFEVWKLRRMQPCPSKSGAPRIGVAADQCPMRLTTLEEGKFLFELLSAVSCSTRSST